MDFHTHKNQAVKLGLTGALIGSSAPVLYILLQFKVFNAGIPFRDYISGVLLGSAQSVTTVAFIATTVFVMGAAGALMGMLREMDASTRAEIEAKNMELEAKQEELTDLTRNLEKKVVEGQEEILDASLRLKKANAKLIRQIDIQRKIAGNVPSLLALIDTDMSYVEMNEYGARVFLDKPITEVLGRRCFEVIGGKNEVCIKDCAAMKAFKTGREATHTRMGLIKGHEVVLENKSIPIKNEEGVVTHVLQIVNDTTAKKKEEEELKRRANIDALTGAYNKHYLDLYMENEEKKNVTDKRKRGPYTIIYGDLDNLKDANDNYGHEAGDILLKKMAQIFQDNTRHEDIVARVGGDEFVVILPHSGPEEGEVLINRFRRQAEEWNKTKDLAARLNDLRLSVSFGISTSIYGTDLASAIKKADSTMYRAKKEKKAVNAAGSA